MKIDFLVDYLDNSILATDAAYPKIREQVLNNTTWKFIGTLKDISMKVID